MILSSDSDQEKNNSLGWQNVENSLKTQNTGGSWVVRWLGLSTFSAKGPGWIPNHETEILHAIQCRQKKHHQKTDAWKRSERASLLDLL